MASRQVTFDHTVNATDLVAAIRINIRVVGLNVARARLRIAGRLFALAAKVSGCDVTVTTMTRKTRTATTPAEQQAGWDRIVRESGGVDLRG